MTSADSLHSMSTSTRPPSHRSISEAARVKALGGEGLMLRKAAAAHRGGRTADLLKVGDGRGGRPPQGG